MSSLASAGLDLHYEDRGTGDAVFLLHGFASTFAGTWERTGWVDALTVRGLRVIGLEFPGHGKSDPPVTVERCSGPRLVEDVLGLLDQLDVPAADLVGFSMGAGVALRLAMSHPDRVRRLAVGGIGDAAVNPHDVSRVAAAFEGEGRDPAGVRIRRNAELAGNDPRALAPYLRGSGWPGGLDELSPISVPVLLFLAADDQYMGETAAIREWLSHAEVLTLPGDHHGVLRNDELKERVIRFLDQPTPARPRSRPRPRRA